MVVTYFFQRKLDAFQSTSPSWPEGATLIAFFEFLGHIQGMENNGVFMFFSWNDVLHIFPKNNLITVSYVVSTSFFHICSIILVFLYVSIAAIAISIFRISRWTSFCSKMPAHMSVGLRPGGSDLIWKWLGTAWNSPKADVNDRFWWAFNDVSSYD